MPIARPIITVIAPCAVVLLLLIAFPRLLSAGEMDKDERPHKSVQLDGAAGSFPGGRHSQGDIKFGAPRIIGEMLPTSFLVVAQAKKSGLIYCYDREAREGIFLWGKAELEIGLDENGKVLDSKWSKPLPGGHDFGLCVKRMVRHWRFSSGPARIVFPMSVSTSTYPR